MKLTFVLACSTLALSACDKEEESGGEMVQIDPPSLAIEPGTAEGVEAECGATDLCSRSIDECEVNLELGECEAWYADTSGCLDMDAYEACNCDCLSQASCDGYFACGEICYADLCQ